MKKILFIILVISLLVLTSCKKEETKELQWLYDNFDYCEIFFYNNLSYHSGENIFRNMDYCAYLYKGCESNPYCENDISINDNYFKIGFINYVWDEIELLRNKELLISDLNKINKENELLREEIKSLKDYGNDLCCIRLDEIRKFLGIGILE